MLLLDARCQACKDPCVQLTDRKICVFVYGFSPFFSENLLGSYRYVYPEAVTPEPTETGYNTQSLEGASSIGEMPYGANGANSYVSNGYNDTGMNGGSAATSPTPYATNGYNGNGYTGYNEGSIVGTNGNGNMCHESGSTISGYNGNENGGAQFVRRRILPAIPKGEKTLIFSPVWKLILYTYHIATY